MKVSFETKPQPSGLVALRISAGGNPIAELELDGSAISALVGQLLVDAHNAAGIGGRSRTKKGELPTVPVSNIATLQSRPHEGKEVVVFQIGDVDLGFAILNSDLQRVGEYLMLAGAERSQKQ